MFVYIFYCSSALFIPLPDFYHHSQADYNVYCATVNLSYVMNINVVGLLRGTLRASMTCGLRDEGRARAVGNAAFHTPTPALLVWMFFVPNPGKT